MLKLSFVAHDPSATSAPKFAVMHDAAFPTTRVAPKGMVTLLAKIGVKSNAFGGAAGDFSGPDFVPVV
jgi:hypothetical protein